MVSSEQLDSDQRTSKCVHIRKNSLISLHLLSEVSIESKENSICMKGIIRLTPLHCSAQEQNTF